MKNKTVAVPIIDNSESDLVAEDKKGIPITKEILLSYGFEIGVTDEYFHHPRMAFMGDYYLPYKIFSDCSCYSFIKDGQSYSHYVRIEYLREMMNLYTALTGERLALKPNSEQELGEADNGASQQQPDSSTNADPKNNHNQFSK